MLVSADPRELAAHAVELGALAHQLVHASDVLTTACRSAATGAGTPVVAAALDELLGVWGTALSSLGAASEALAQGAAARAGAFRQADGG